MRCTIRSATGWPEPSESAMPSRDRRRSFGRGRSRDRAGDRDSGCRRRRWDRGRRRPAPLALRLRHRGRSTRGGPSIGSGPLRPGRLRRPRLPPRRPRRRSRSISRGRCTSRARWTSRARCTTRGGSTTRAGHLPQPAGQGPRPPLGLSRFDPREVPGRLGDVGRPRRGAHPGRRRSEGDRRAGRGPAGEGEGR